MNLQELQNLDINQIGSWPTPIRAAAVVGLCILLAVGWYSYFTKDQLTQLENEESKEQQLKTTFQSKQKLAANLEGYKKQLKEMEQSFGAMLRTLPDKTEVAGLLVDVSQTGLAAGLEFQLFDPGTEARKEFYAELPIKLRVVGSYHEFGAFVSGLASLPRIVTIHDVVIAPKETGLDMSAVAKTYRYLDEAQ